MPADCHVRKWRDVSAGAPLPRGRYDLIFARWVFLFLPDPEAHLRKLVRALRPGGLLALQDYDRHTFALVPRPPAWANLVAADHAFFATQGGDGSVGARLPVLYRRAGLTVVETVPHIKTGHPASPVWKWLSDYYLGVLDRYAELPPLTKEQAAQLRRSWLAAEKDKTSLLIGPTVLDVVGRKPR